MLFINSLLITCSTALIVVAISASAGSLLPQQQHQTITNLQLSRQQPTNQATNPLHHISALSSHPQQPQQLATMTNSLNNPYSLATHALLLDLRQQLITRTLKFDEHFRSLLSSSKISLHNMFLDTYGMMYQQNSEIFTSMYESLEQYYATGQIHLTKSMQDFFVKLYQKIFQAFNLNRIFTAGYMTCATEQLEHLKPFKDAPEKLIGEIRHAFVAARTFNQALNSGIDVIKSIISLQLDQPIQCTNLINERLMKYNGASMNTLVPCLNYCEQVITRCVGRSNLDQLSDRWKAYVLSLTDLAKKLSVHYNIETIIAPLDVQISEAIMNFQENATNITEQVAKACGPNSGTIGGAAGLIGQKSSLSSSLALKPNSPQTRTRKRAAPTSIGSSLQQRSRQGLNSFHHQPDGSLSDDFLSFNGGQHNSMSRNKNTLGRSSSTFEDGSRMIEVASSPTSSVLGLGSNSHMAGAKRRPIIIDDIREFMLSTKLFWANLPNSVCTNNGSSSAAMILGASAAQQKVILSRKPPQCFEEQLGLSDMNSDLRYRMQIQQQVSRLESIQEKIRDALQGVEIDWTSKLNNQQAQQQSSIATASTASIQQQQQQPSQQQQARPLGVPYTSPSPTASSCSEDESEDDDESIESGSGDGPCSKADPENSSAPTDDSTTPDDSDYQDGDDSGLEAPVGNDDDYSSTSNNSDNVDTTTQQPSTDNLGNNEQVSGSDNSLDSYAGQPPRIVNLDIPNELITAPDAQKSSANGNHGKLSSVISSFNIVMLLLILLSLANTVALNHQSNLVRQRWRSGPRAE